MKAGFALKRQILHAGWVGSRETSARHRHGIVGQGLVIELKFGARRAS